MSIVDAEFNQEGGATCVGCTLPTTLMLDETRTRSALDADIVA